MTRPARSQPRLPEPRTLASAQVTDTPMWEPTPDDPDLRQAAEENPSVAGWIEALASLGKATANDNLEEQLYDQAPDALRQLGIEPTPTAIDDWVRSQHPTTRP